MSERAKLCIISQYFLPDINGDVIRLLNSLKVLRKLNLDITIITAFPHYPTGKIPKKYGRKLFVRERWSNIKIIRTFILPLPHKGFIKRLLLYTSFTFSSIIAILTVGKVNMVWAFSQKFFSYMTGLTFKLIYNAKLIIDITDIWPEAIVNTGYMKNDNLMFKATKKIINFFFKMSDKITTLTKAMKDMIISRGINPYKISIIPNVIRLSPQKIQSQQTSEKFIVMYSGNLGPNYDFKTLLETALKLKDEDILFIIRGTGEMESYISEYIKINRLQNLKLDKKILPKNELIKYLSRADVFLLPMKKHPYPDASFPIKFLDYLSCGKPIICCAEGFLSNLVMRYQVGIAIPPANPDKLFKAILTLKDNSETREKMSKNAQLLASRLFSFNVLEKEFSSLIKSLQ